jgi:hypothetical protein
MIPSSVFSPSRAAATALVATLVLGAACSSRLANDAASTDAGLDDAAPDVTGAREAAADVTRPASEAGPDGGGADAPVDAGPDWALPGPSPAAFLDVLAQQWCQLMTPYCACYGAYEWQPTCGVVTQTGCDAVDGWRPRFPPPYEAAIRSGAHVTLDLSQADACLMALQNWFASNSSNFSVALYNSCVTVFVGTIPLGQAGCTSSIECADGYCDTSSSTCKPLLANGAPCQTGDQCDRLAALASASWCAPGQEDSGAADGSAGDAGAGDGGGASGARCALTLPFGAPCVENNDCWSGMCAGTCVPERPGPHAGYDPTQPDSVACAPYIAASAGAADAGMEGGD